MRGIWKESPEQFDFVSKLAAYEIHGISDVRTRLWSKNAHRIHTHPHTHVIVVVSALETQVWLCKLVFNAIRMSDMLETHCEKKHSIEAKYSIIWSKSNCKQHFIGKLSQNFETIISWTLTFSVFFFFFPHLSYFCIIFQIIFNIFHFSRQFRVCIAFYFGKLSHHLSECIPIFTIKIRFFSSSVSQPPPANWNIRYDFPLKCLWFFSYFPPLIHYLPPINLF